MPKKGHASDISLGKRPVKEIGFTEVKEKSLTSGVDHQRSNRLSHEVNSISIALHGCYAAHTVCSSIVLLFVLLSSNHVRRCKRYRSPRTELRVLRKGLGGTLCDGYQGRIQKIQKEGAEETDDAVLHHSGSICDQTLGLTLRTFQKYRGKRGERGRDKLATVECYHQCSNSARLKLLKSQKFIADSIYYFSG